MKLVCFMIGLVMFCYSPKVLAQTTVLRGAVTDESGAVVPGATVTMTALGRAARAQKSDGKGGYQFAGIEPGAYTMQAAAPGLIQSPFVVEVTSGQNTVNFQLHVAPVTERVDVSQDGAQPISTEASSNATALVIKGDDLDSLSDDPEDLMADLQALAGPSAGPNGGSVFIDGFSGGQLPPKEQIREVRINQNPFSPEFDKLGQGRIEILTKPGSDKWKGNLNYNFATDAWNSRNPYSAIKAPLRLNEWENVLGGRLSKRASLSMDVNQNNVDNGAIVNSVTLDPKTLTAAPFFDIFKTIQRRTNLFPRVDYQLNDNNTLTLRYAFTHGTIDGAGISGFNLTSRGENRNYTINTVQVIETAVLGAGAVHESRFQYYRNAFSTTPNDSEPAIQVIGAFNGGGTPTGASSNIEQDYELQDITTIAHGRHTLRFGTRIRAQQIEDIAPRNFNGTFTFSGGIAPVLDASNNIVLDSAGKPVVTEIQAIDRYRRTLYLQQLGYSLATIRTLGGGASQFTIGGGQPGISGVQADFSPFIGDDWRVRPNLTLNLGLRYEAQTNLPNWNAWAPRVGLAWAPGGAGNKQPKTVLRAGFGIFYDRFGLNNVLTAKRFDGIVQQQYVVTNPDFFPNIPALSSLAKAPQSIQSLDDSLRAPYLFQGAFTVERQLPGGTTVALTYTASRGVHILRSVDANAPIGGVFPLGSANPLFLMASSGIYNQNQFAANFNSKINKAVSLTGSYTLGRARSNSDGLGTFPANPYNYTGEYGPASNDIRHRVSFGGTINLRWGLRFSPLVNIQSGGPFDITTGSDLYGTTLFNGRPAFATDPTRPGLVRTEYGLLDPSPIPGEVLAPRNYGRGPGQTSVNLRVGKQFKFGPASAKGERRFTGTIQMSGRNILNHTNPGPIIGVISSPLFGRANSMAGNLNGEGFSENANNRRFELQTKITF
jgi:hypothetical protein